MSASCEEEKHTARKRKVIPLLKGNEIKLWIYKRKELKENLIFTCWSLINISSDEAFWSPHSFSGTVGRTETFHFIFVSTEHFSPSRWTNWWKNNTPREADFVFQYKYSIFDQNFYQYPASVDFLA